MGEKTILVCDICGQPATETVGIRVGRRSLVKDLCDTHLAELTVGARRARPGRRRAAVVAGAKKTTVRRVGRPRKRPVAAPPAKEG